MKFITDRNLGKLTKWLRILGYDTVYYTGDIDRNFLRKGAGEGRVVLTRRRDMAKRNYLGHMEVVYTDNVPNQIREIKDKLSLNIEPDNFLSICLECNQKLQPVTKSDVEGIVPVYVFETQESFRICPRCERIYWPGTHKDRIFRFLKKHNLYHLP